MRLLLSRAIPSVAILVLAGAGLAQSTTSHRPLTAESALAKQAASPPPVTDRVLLRLVGAVGTPPPTPPPPPRPVAVAIPRRTARPAAHAPGHVAIGTGQWGLINQDRAAAGLPPLQWNACLANIATGQAQRMAAQGYISHANGRILDLGCHLGTYASESIGYQGGGINDAAMNTWFMNDPIHRDNIMGPYHYVGSAWVVAANGAAYLAIEFG